jgi:hypothetical protein
LCRRRNSPISGNAQIRAQNQQAVFLSLLLLKQRVFKQGFCSVNAARGVWIKSRYLRGLETEMKI